MPDPPHATIAQTLWNLEYQQACGACVYSTGNCDQRRHTSRVQNHTRLQPDLWCNRGRDLGFDSDGASPLVPV